MKTTNCEDILMAAMAAADGEEEAFLSGDRIETHLAGCGSCRLEMGQQESMTALFTNYERRVPNADLWPSVSGRIETHGISAAGHGWYLFAVLGLALAGYKLVEMLPENDPGYLLKIAPLIAAGVLFLLLRENPFKINTELITE